MKQITSIDFWQRSADSIEKIESLKLVLNDDVFTIYSNNNKKVLSKEESDEILSTLNNTFDIEHYDQEYLGYKYEDDKLNYTIRFFLTINYSNATYLIIKGIRPFKQPHYKEIIAFFSKYYLK